MTETDATPAVRPGTLAGELIRFEVLRAILGHEVLVDPRESLQLPDWWAADETLLHYAAALRFALEDWHERYAEWNEQHTCMEPVLPVVDLASLAAPVRHTTCTRNTRIGIQRINNATDGWRVFHTRDHAAEELGDPAWHVARQVVGRERVGGRPASPEDQATAVEYLRAYTRVPWVGELAEAVTGR
jgi:hypothetical protein